MDLSSVFSRISADMPWGSQVRLVVGSLASRESVKDVYFDFNEKRPVLPAWSICSLGELAREVHSRLRPGVRLEKPLMGPSQCDALEKIARLPWVQEAAPRFSKHLKARPVALKVARFLSQLDQFFINDLDREAAIEALSEREPEFGAFLNVIQSLWNIGELKPWGDGDALRTTIEALQSLEGTQCWHEKGLPKDIYFWAFSEMTPLEELFIKSLQKHCQLIFLNKQTQFINDSENAQGVDQLSLQVPLVLKEDGAPLPPITTWKPHSTWDEMSFLHDELKRLIEAGELGDGRWGDLAITVPGDDLYKRLVRSELQSWNIPLKDPTLAGGWRDNPCWVWWRDYLRAMTSGLAASDVRALLGPGRTMEETELRRKLYEAAYRFGVQGSSSQWKKLLQAYPIPELQILVEGTTLFGKVITCEQFSQAAEHLIDVARKLKIPAADSEILGEFGEELLLNRPFLKDFKGRLTRYVPLFEEFLEARGRRESSRSFDGAWFIGHGVWLPRQVKYQFILGANALEPKRISDDPLSFEGPWRHENEKVRRLWSRLHFIDSPDHRREREVAELRMSLTQSNHLTVSEVLHDLTGRPWARSGFTKSICDGLEPVRSGGAVNVGWSRGFMPQTIPPTVSLKETIDTVSKLWTDKPLRVSAFEDFLKCPFLFYARHVLKLEPDPELSLDPNGRIRGTLLHRILERFLRTELAEGFEKDFARGQVRLTGLLDQELSLKPLEGLYRDKSLLVRARAATLVLLERWWEYEFENRNKFPEVKPFAVEVDLKFELLPGLMLSGRADRVDSDGKHSVVIDYKSSTSSLIGKELLAGMGSQLMVYSQAVRNLHGFEPAGMWYLEIGRKVSGKSGVFLKKHKGVFHDAHARNSGLVDKTFDEVLEPVLQHWEDAGRRLMAADFSPRPARTKDCPRCAFKLMCGFPTGYDGSEEELS